MKQKCILPHDTQPHKRVDANMQCMHRAPLQLWIFIEPLCEFKSKMTKTEVDARMCIWYISRLYRAEAFAQNGFHR